ncbi:MULTISPECIES: hypothetical protein [unclassified Frankia]|uniref:hypothetical protein n=1 Tax=unclassified Frankia TaxID=2632575 RepID=UPI001EF6292B|nr:MULTISPECIES: hypothetical protein [unclassified Frankia]
MIPWKALSRTLLIVLALIVIPILVGCGADTGKSPNQARAEQVARDAGWIVVGSMPNDGRYGDYPNWIIQVTFVDRNGVTGSAVLGSTPYNSAEPLLGAEIYEINGEGVELPGIQAAGIPAQYLSDIHPEDLRRHVAVVEDGFEIFSDSQDTPLRQSASPLPAAGSTP